MRADVSVQTREQVVDGVHAGVLPPKLPHAATRSARGGQVAVTGTIRAAAIEAVREKVSLLISWQSPKVTDS